MWKKVPTKCIVLPKKMFRKAIGMKWVALVHSDPHFSIIEITYSVSVAEEPEGRSALW